MKRRFERWCKMLAELIGTPVTFVALFLLITLAFTAAIAFPALRDAINLWGGSITGYVSILLLVVLQNSQNRSEAASQAREDELIRANKEARNVFIRAEELPLDEIQALRDSA